MNVLSVTFDQSIASLQNKSINLKNDPKLGSVYARVLVNIAKLTFWRNN